MGYELTDDDNAEAVASFADRAIASGYVRASVSIWVKEKDREKAKTAMKRAAAKYKKSPASVLGPYDNHA